MRHGDKTNLRKAINECPLDTVYQSSCTAGYYEGEKHFSSRDTGEKHQ